MIERALRAHLRERLRRFPAVAVVGPRQSGKTTLAAALADHWLRGGYPDGGILDPQRFPEWQDSYLSLLAQRDLPTWGLPARPQIIDRLLRR